MKRFSMRKRKEPCSELKKAKQLHEASGIIVKYSSMCFTTFIHTPVYKNYTSYIITIKKDIRVCVLCIIFISLIMYINYVSCR